MNKFDKLIKLLREAKLEAIAIKQYYVASELRSFEKDFEYTRRVEIGEEILAGINKDESDLPDQASGPPG